MTKPFQEAGIEHLASLVPEVEVKEVTFKVGEVVNVNLNKTEKLAGKISDLDSESAIVDLGTFGKVKFAWSEVEKKAFDLNQEMSHVVQEVKLKLSQGKTEPVITQELMSMGLNEPTIENILLEARES